MADFDRSPLAGELCKYEKAYDDQVDILTIDFEIKRICVSEEILPGVIADFGVDGKLVGFEIMDASKFTDLSKSLLTISSGLAPRRREPPFADWY